MSSTDSLGNVTRWEHDEAGNTIAEIDPSGATVTWQYDAAGRMIGTTDQLGRTETYAYDADGRLVTEVWKDGTGAVVNTLRYTYNNAGDALTERKFLLVNSCCFPPISCQNRTNQSAPWAY